MAYCTVTDIRNITNLTETDISDSAISNLISWATTQLNGDIGATLWIKLGDTAFTIGDIDGSNKTYTLRYAPIGDMNNDGTVDTNDIEVWRKLSTEDHFTKWNNAISSIDDDEIGKITFASAPTTDYDYWIKYVWFPIKFNHPLITRACAELTAYLCFLKLNLKDVSSYRIGKVSVTKVDRHPGLVSFYDRYQATLGKIRGTTMFRPVKWEMIQKMSKELIETLPGAKIGKLLPGEKP